MNGFRPSIYWEIAIDAGLIKQASPAQFVRICGAPSQGMGISVDVPQE